MTDTMDSSVEKSTADMVFDKLHEEIASLEILPGSKISEADVARRFGVSRQPARDAFKRLHNLDLLEIRPKRATVVRRFSLSEIENIRFMRLAVELEVIERAAKIWDQKRANILNDNLARQSAAVADKDSGTFHLLDYEFHKIICDQVNLPMAFQTINNCRRKVDRLCVLSLTKHENVADILNDHRAIEDALSRRSVQDARTFVRKHISRLDATISAIHQANSNYFQ